MSDINITVSGAAGSGKSAVARLLEMMIYMMGDPNITITITVDPSVDQLSDDDVEQRLDSLSKQGLHITIYEQQLARSPTIIRSRP